MRLFLLPISTRRTLIYCERAQEALTNGASPAAAKAQPYSERILNKASTTWASWEKAEKGWQKQITVYGNQLFKRIPFEEWGLKSFPPGTRKALLDLDAQPDSPPWECLYPTHFVGLHGGSKANARAVSPGEQTGPVTALLQQLATERQGLHNRRLWTSIALMPVSAPFTLVPVIPNLPFFYLCFRAYSHYRALYGSKFLAHLLGKDRVRATASTRMDKLYTAGLMHGSAEKVKSVADPEDAEVADVVREVQAQVGGEGREEVMLLKTWNGKVIAEEFGLPEMEVEIERAVWQVERAIRKEKEKRGSGGNPAKKGVDEVKETVGEVNSSMGAKR
nr:uncharacterized protein c23h3.12c [Quercus suber]